MSELRKPDAPNENTEALVRENQEHQTEEDRFFADLFNDFEALRAKPHLVQTAGCPPQETLRYYVQGALPDHLTLGASEEDFLKFLAGETEWNKSTVSLHAICCAQCKEFVELERSKLAQNPSPEKKRFWQRQKDKPITLELGWRATLASATLTAILITLNWWPWVSTQLGSPKETTSVPSRGEATGMKLDPNEHFTPGDEEPYYQQQEEEIRVPKDLRMYYARASFNITTQGPRQVYGTTVLIKK
jgi:hypothetical protein